MIWRCGAGSRPTWPPICRRRRPSSSRRNWRTTGRLWPGWLEFCERLRAHLRDYGHIIYNLDFARPLPLDDATPMLQSIKMYLAGQGVNPHERQAAAEEKRIEAAEATLNRLRGVRRWAFRKTLGMAQTMAAVRENALSDIGLGYPVLREMLRELGRRLVEAGGIAASEDIFWLEAEQVRRAVDALERGEPVRDMTEEVAQRKARTRRSSM